MEAFIGAVITVCVIIVMQYSRKCPMKTSGTEAGRGRGGVHRNTEKALKKAYLRFPGYL